MCGLKRKRLLVLAAAATLPFILGTSCLVDLPGGIVILPGVTHGDRHDDFYFDVYVEDDYYDDDYYDDYYDDDYYYDFGGFFDSW